MKGKARHSAEAGKAPTAINQFELGLPGRAIVDDPELQDRWAERAQRFMEEGWALIYASEHPLDEEATLAALTAFLRADNIFRSLAEIDLVWKNHRLVEEASDKVNELIKHLKRIGENERRPGYTGPRGEIMGDETAILNAASELLSKIYPRDRVLKALGNLAAETAHEDTAPATEKPRPEAASREMLTTRKRGPRIKPNPALPSEAPEKYADRKPREELGGRKENIIEFIERVYAPWREILTRADLRRLDKWAEKGVDNWITSGRNLPEGLLLTEYELNREKRATEARRRAKRKSRARAPANV